ncbi:MAG: ABC transporter permease [Candidatus Omnitrophica bacterium]|nr:ABC transporter permease [Candidatus Omnitrophota bacterium]
MKGKIYYLFRIVKIGVKNLYLHKLRSFLTILGIVFGVASVIAMLAIGEGASYEAREKIKELGSQNIIIKSVKIPETRITQEATTFVGVYGLIEKDYEMIKTIPSVDFIVPTWEMKEDIRYMEKNIQGRIVCTYPEYKDVMNVITESGRFFSQIDFELFKPYAVIGASIKKNLFPTEDPIGKTITVRSYNFKVIGVAKEKGIVSGTTGFIAEDINFDVYIPFTTGRAYFGEFEISSKQGPIMRWERNWVKYHRFIVKVNDTDKILTTSAIIENILKTNHKKDDYEILVPLQLLIQAEHTKRIFNIVLGSIAAISLIVGGIGIMNIMLATVTERTREIGIRRAVGAKRKDIISQFLLETVILSSTGGFIGILLGILIPKLVTKFAGMTTIITWWSILLSFTISVGVGISFGIYPARKAAYLDPIQALRYE